MKLFDLHADLGHAVLKKKRAGYTDILSSFYTEGLQTGGIKAVCMASYFDGRQDWAQMQEMVLTLREAIDECPAVRLVDDARKIDWTDPYLYAMLSIEGMWDPGECGRKAGLALCTGRTSGFLVLE